MKSFPSARICYPMETIGTAAPHPVNLKWTELTIGQGGKRCVMMITPKRKEVG
jgi:hypothetical protein